MQTPQDPPAEQNLQEEHLEHALHGFLPVQVAGGEGAQKILSVFTGVEWVNSRDVMNKMSP